MKINKINYFIFPGLILDKKLNKNSLISLSQEIESILVEKYSLIKNINSVDKFSSPKRRTPDSDIRFLYLYLIDKYIRNNEVKLEEFKLISLAKKMGFESHASIIYGIKLIKNLKITDKKIKKDLEDIELKINLFLKNLEN